MIEMFVAFLAALVMRDVLRMALTRYLDRVSWRWNESHTSATGVKRRAIWQRRLQPFVPLLRKN